MEEVQYCADPARVRMFHGVPAALARLKAAGFRNIIVTNQSGIGRGLFTLDQYQSVQAELLRQIGPGLIDATYYCADAPGEVSLRRKPRPGMVLEAAAAHSIDLENSFFIGDKTSDIDCGRAAGTTTILVATGYGAYQECHPTYRARDLTEAVNLVLGSHSVC